MTHFVVLIIIPRSIYDQGKTAVNKYILKTMKPYDENLQLTPYILHTKQEINEQYETFKITRDKEDEKKAENSMKNINTLDDFITQWNEYTLDENGNAMTTYNTNCIYDYYVIGGRFDGILIGKRTLGFNFGKQYQTIKNNSMKCEYLLKKINENKIEHIDSTITTIIDTSGVVHKSGETGWFASFEETVDATEWKQQYTDLFTNSKDDCVINLDCHI
jgi:hypothetical protein